MGRCAVAQIPMLIQTKALMTSHAVSHARMFTCNMTWRDMVGTWWEHGGQFSGLLGRGQKILTSHPLQTAHCACSFETSHCCDYFYGGKSRLTCIYVHFDLEPLDSRSLVRYGATRTNTRTNKSRFLQRPTCFCERRRVELERPCRFVLQWEWQWRKFGA